MALFKLMDKYKKEFGFQIFMVNTNMIKQGKMIIPYLFEVFGPDMPE